METMAVWGRPFPSWLGERLFEDPEIAIEFVERIRSVKERDGWTVFAWCVMSNHFHLAVRASGVPVWRGMHRIQCMFSRGFNRRSARAGGCGSNGARL